MSFFEFPFHNQDLVDKFLRDNKELVPDWVSGPLREFGLTEQARDDDVEDFLGSESFAPAVGVSLTVAQSIDDATPETIVWDGQDFASTDLLVWNSSSRITVGAAGIVSTTAYLSFAANATGGRFIQFAVNGSLVSGAAVSLPAVTAALTASLNMTMVQSLVAGDYIELVAFQASGGGLNAVAAQMSAVFLGSSG